MEQEVQQAQICGKQTTNNKQQTTNNKQQTTNNKQQTTNNKPLHNGYGVIRKTFSPSLQFVYVGTYLISIVIGGLVMKKVIASSLVLASLFAQSAMADVCDHRPSKLIGGKATTGVVVGTGATAAAGVGAKAAGLYAITNATTGAAMLGSTAAGASAAGTTGIIAGTAGAAGTVGAVLLSPAVIIPAAVAAVGVGGYEGICHLRDK